MYLKHTTNNSVLKGICNAFFNINLIKVQSQTAHQKELSSGWRINTVVPSSNISWLTAGQIIIQFSLLYSPHVHISFSVQRLCLCRSVKQAVVGEVQTFAGV